MAELKDSGARREFASGAVRDIQEGKGRCDLIPLDIASRIMSERGIDSIDPILMSISLFQETGRIHTLYTALTNCDIFTDRETMLLEVSKHFEDGCKKYGENNWRKGIDVQCYIDSAIRHYLKFRRGDTDEPHDRAFCWNIICAIWTCIHLPELNTYQKLESRD